MSIETMVWLLISTHPTAVRIFFFLSWGFQDPDSDKDISCNVPNSSKKLPRKDAFCLLNLRDNFACNTAVWSVLTRLIVVMD